MAAVIATAAVFGIVAMTAAPSWAVRASAAAASGAASVPGATAPAVLSLSRATADADTMKSAIDDARSAIDEGRSALAAVVTIAGEVAVSDLDLGAAPTDIDTTGLREALGELEAYEITPTLLLPDLTRRAELMASLVTAQVDGVQLRLETAAREKAEAEAAAAAAAAAAEKAKREAEAKAAALAAANTVTGAKATARELAASRYGWGEGQFSCLESLWTRESGWNYRAYNASSGATGIPQSLPGSKMASAGADWQTNATTQIRWGLSYIERAYGSPCNAWGHSQSTGWY